MSDIERTTDGADPHGRPVDILALVSGVAVLAFCTAISLGDIDTLGDQLHIVWPLVLGAVGIALLAGVRRR